jgi:hypothetical protein
MFALEKQYVTLPRAQSFYPIPVSERTDKHHHGKEVLWKSNV